jgi:tetratricopeptide (TPR) repeat protein
MKRCLWVAKIFGISLLALPCAASAAKAPAAQPRRLSAAERQAVVFAAEYLERGAAAWWDHLSRRSPLRRLGRQAALAEIEVRAGAPAEAQWELQTAPPGFSCLGAVFSLSFSTGIDDTLDLGLVEEAGAWKIDTLRISAEPIRGQTVGGREVAWSAPAPPLLPGLAAVPLWVLLTAGTGGALLLLTAWFERARRRRAIGLALAGVLAAGSAVAVAVLPRILSRPVARPSPELAGQAELRSLLPLRRAFTGPGGAVPDAPPPEIRREGLSGAVARLWWAQQLLSGTKLRAANQALASFPSPSPFPLAELLRARLAFLRLEEVPTALAYHRAVAAGTAHESLLSEAAQAFLLLGFDEHAKEFLRRLRDLGSRQAATYLASAEIALTDGDRFAEARDLFRTGWRLQPSPRAEVLGNPILVALLADREIRELIGIAAAGEPAAVCAERARRAIVLPPGFQARLLGRTLRLVRGDSELRVPGGCEVAPQDAAYDHAETWSRERAAKLLKRLPALLAAAHTTGALAQPSLRRATEDTAEALAERNRWADLLALTDGLSGEPSSLPPGLVRLRAEALRRSSREAEARDLLIRLARSNTAERRTDPATLYQLADLFAREGSFDPAIRLVAKADSQLPYDPGGELLRRLQMEKRLAASFEVYRSPHFDIRYPPRRGKKFVRQVADILEAERRRLQAWIPLTSSRVTTVHVLPVDEFRLGYSASLDVLGLYDGTIRVPLGDVPQFVPWIVSILTHELAHAMIAESTDDCAPRWFHEGLAQHVEMAEEDVNPIPGYHDKRNLLGFPLIDPAIASYSPALVLLGYDEARWTLHYIERRYGKPGIRRLLAAFRAGRSTEEALATAFGSTVGGFDQDLWRWALSAPEVWKREVVRYDE